MEKPELRIALVGKVGVGKSATGNTILGRRAFTSRPSPLPLTKKCEKETREFGGFKLVVVDTPGLCDPRKEEDMEKEIKRCISLCAPGPHAFLVVITPSFTKEEEETVMTLQNMFGPEVKKHIMVIISHGDELKRSGVSLEESFKEYEPAREFITQCNGGYHVFDNTVKDQSQVGKLVENINCMAGNYYTHDMFETAQKPSIGSAYGSDLHPALSVVLVGHEKVGKSSAGNTILGKNVFDNTFSMSPVTLKSQMKKENVLGRWVSVVDTPGLFSSVLTEGEVNAELQRALELSSPGPHAFLVTIQLGRFTEQEQEVLKTLEKFLGPAVHRRTIVLFTYGDRLVNTSIEDFVQGDQNLHKLLKGCSGQYQLFNNIKMENSDQVEELLSKVEDVWGEGVASLSLSQRTAVAADYFTPST